MMPIYFRFPTSLDESLDGYILVLEILVDGSIRRIYGDAGLVDEDLQALGQASHLDRLMTTGLGQRLRHYVQSALQSGNSLQFSWSHWNNLPPVYHEIKITPNDALSAANVVVSRAHGLHGRAVETSWAFQALRHVSDGVVVAEAEQTLGGDPRIIYVNPGFTALSGFQLDDLFGKNAKSLFGSENGQHGVSRLRALVGHSGVAERVLSCKDGSKRAVELDIKSITDDAGWLVQWILVIRGDKPSRSGDRRARLVDDALHGARTGVIITDSETRGSGPSIVYANNELCRVTGYTAAELIGRNAFFLLGPRPENQAITGLRHALERGTFDQQVVRCYHKDGAELWLRWQPLSPVYDEHHRIKNFLILVQDVTPEWTDIETQIRDSHRDSLGILAAGTAHDLNNILTFICSNSMLAREDVPATAAMALECLQQIDDAAMSASRLMRQLLNFARAEASVETAVSLPKLLREAVKFSLQGSGVTSKFDIDEECPPVLASDSRLRLAISALVINSREAMPAGGKCTATLDRVTLAPGALPCLLPGNYAQITLTDSGRGIAPDDFSCVFDPHFTTKKGGHGLGLTVARAIIEKYGGHLALKSTPGEGTTASIYLPVYAGGMEETPSTDNEVVHGSGRILLMDDDAKLRERLEKSVRTLGYNPCVAQHGEEALELYAAAQEKGERFDLVVLDLTVPGGMGAKATLPKLRALDPSVKVVIATGYNEADVLSSVSELGFDALLPKPYTFAELSRVLAGAIGSPSRNAH